MDQLFNWAYNNGGIAVAFVVNTAILVYVLKSIDAKLEKLNVNFEKFFDKKRR
jgi:hypothetical protein